MTIREDAVIHDGIVDGDHIYFTAVDGIVIRVDGRTGMPDRFFDLNDMVPGRLPLGWCRGIAHLGGTRFAVGFSRLRPTRWEENLTWVRHRLGGSGINLMPTRIGVFDLERGALLEEYGLEEVGLNAVFSVHFLERPIP
jgi:hypothetical protein